MSIEEMIKNGASPEEINAAMQEIYLEKEREDKVHAKKEQERMLKALDEHKAIEARAEEAARKEMLKREARACLINAILAYNEAFNLMPESKELEKDIESLEQLIIKMEDMIPLYYQIAKLQEEMNEIGKDDEDFGLFGFGGRL